jgi:hypothetical protein
LTSIVALALGCVYEPVEIARFTTNEGESGWSGEVTSDDGSGSASYSWDEMQLHDGRTLIVELGWTDAEVSVSGEGVHAVVIELQPVEPTALPDGFTVSLEPPGGEGFEPFGAGLRYEGELEFGWTLLLHADELAEVEIYARVFAP